MKFASIGSEEERFWRKVAVTGNDDCWLWTAGVDKDGYGKFQTGVFGSQRHYRSHRYAYELRVGPITDNMLVLHRCDTPACCNPKHLFLGTQKINRVDCKDKGRTSRGEKHPNARLDEASVVEIRKRFNSGETVLDLASLFNVSRGAIYGCVKRTNWAHVK